MKHLWKKPVIQNITATELRSYLAVNAYSGGASTCNGQPSTCGVSLDATTGCAGTGASASVGDCTLMCDMLLVGLR